MATTAAAASGLDSAPANLRLTPEKYTTLNTLLDHNKPEVMEELVKTYGEQGITGFLKLTGAINSGGSADQIEYFEEGRRHRTITGSLDDSNTGDQCELHVTADSTNGVPIGPNDVLMDSKDGTRFIVIDADTTKDVMYMALIENIQREDLNTLEEAKGYKYLQENLQSSITEIAKTVGKSRPAVSNALRLLKLPDQIQDSILKGEINAGKARAILQRKTTQGMLQLWQKLLTEKISVRKTEKLASKRKVSPQLQNIQDKLSRLIGEKVVINQNAKTRKGFIKINFSKKTVSRVLDKLQSIKSD